MKKVVVVISVAMVLILAALAGCTPKPAAPTTSTISGTVTDINTPAEPGPDVVTVQTPQGPQTFTITPATDFSYNNTACPIEEAGKLVTQNGTNYTCTVEYDETYHAIAVGIWKQ